MRELTESQAEELCRGVGMVAAEALPGDGGSPDPRQWAALQAAMVTRRSPRRLMLRLAWLGVPAAALAATALMLTLRARPAPLTYLVEGCTIAPDGRLTTAPERSASVRFSDGSTVTLAGGSQGRIAAAGPGESAEVELDDGRVQLSVHHGPRTRWAAIAGPFRVEVTGTRFDVDWSRDRRRFAVNVHEGRVIVRGATAREGISVSAGERLVSSLDEGSILKETLGASVEHSPAAPVAAEPLAPEPAPAAAEPAPAAPAVPAVPATPAPMEIRRAPRAVTPSRAPVPQAPVRPAVVVPATEPAAPEHVAPALDPPLPPPVPRPPVEVPRPVLGAGGDECKFLAQYQFEMNVQGFESANWPSRALGNPRVDHEHSWCGTGSMRLDASFRTSGPRNRLNQLYGQSGDVSVRLASGVDIIGRTISVHLYADAPADAQLGVMFYIVSHGRYAFGGSRTALKPNRWNVVEFTIPAEMQSVDGPTVRMDDVWRFGVVMSADGKRRDWAGAVYVDDIAIR